jgi:hypothetical protein
MKSTMIAAVVAPLLGGFEGARLVSGAAPQAWPPHAVAGAEVLLELKVSANGDVSAIATLRDGPPFTEGLREAVGRWRFEPAREAGAPVAAAVLVAGVFRPPVLTGGTRSPSPLPLEARPACDELPLPVEAVTPLYPPLGVGDRAVLAEAWVEQDGHVAALRILEGDGAFAGAASEAARRWRFRPACRAGAPLPARAYLVFGFRAPVVPPVKR